MEILLVAGSHPFGLEDTSHDWCLNLSNHNRATMKFWTNLGALLFEANIFRLLK
jgi:hypothetical protein